MPASCGASLSALIVIETVAGAEVARASLAVKVKLSGPLASALGVYSTSAVQTFGVKWSHVTAPIAPSVPLVGVPPIAKLSGSSPSASLADSVIVFAVSSFVLTVCAAATGATLGGWTTIASMSVSVCGPPAPLCPASLVATVSSSSPV